MRSGTTRHLQLLAVRATSHYPRPRTGYLAQLAHGESWRGPEGEWSGATPPSGPGPAISRSSSPRLSVAPAPWRSRAASLPAVGPRRRAQLPHLSLIHISEP